MGNHTAMLKMTSSKFKRKINFLNYSYIKFLSSIAGSTILITGASSGIGKELTFKYA